MTSTLPAAQGVNVVLTVSAGFTHVSLSDKSEAEE